MPASQRRAISLLLSAAKEIREARRLSPATGVPALEALLKKEAAEAYSSRTPSSYVPWEADCIAEPKHPDQSCDMLTHFPGFAA